MTRECPHAAKTACAPAGATAPCRPGARGARLLAGGGACLLLASVAFGAAALLPASPAVADAQAKTSLASDKVSFTYAKTKYYTGKAVKPKVKAYYKGKLIDSENLSVSYSKNTQAGTARILVRGTGTFKGERTLKFRIYYNMAEAKVTIPKPNYKATGRAVKPKPTVTFRGVKVPRGSYTVSYSNNVEGDHAKVTVTGTGAYQGSKSCSFKVVGKGGLVVDVSEHNGTIDWKKASQEIDLAILRSHVTYSLGAHAHKKKGDGQMRQDLYYEEYATACEQNKVPFGSYAYLVFQGTTRKQVIADAKDQAKRFYKYAFSNGHRPLFLALDLEDSLMRDEGSKVAYGAQAAAEQLRSLAKKDGIKNLKVGLYCGGSSYDTFGFATTAGQKIARESLDFTWYPAYGKDTGYLPTAKRHQPVHPDAWDMWQYSSKGRVSGISGFCDVSTTRSSGPHARSLSWYKKR